jgi:hypothetical protein
MISHIDMGRVSSVLENDSKMLDIQYALMQLTAQHVTEHKSNECQTQYEL